MEMSVAAIADGVPKTKAAVKNGNYHSLVRNYDPGIGRTKHESPPVLGSAREHADRNLRCHTHSSKKAKMKKGIGALEFLYESKQRHFVSTLLLLGFSVLLFVWALSKRGV